MIQKEVGVFGDPLMLVMLLSRFGATYRLRPTREDEASNTVICAGAKIGHLFSVVRPSLPRRSCNAFGTQEGLNGGWSELLCALTDLATSLEDFLVSRKFGCSRQSHWPRFWGLWYMRLVSEAHQLLVICTSCQLCCYLHQLPNNWKVVMVLSWIACSDVGICMPLSNGTWKLQIALKVDILGFGSCGFC